MNRYFEAEYVQLVHSGRDHFEIMEQIINGAREVIHLQTYIFSNDTTGQRIINALKKATKKGVRVYVLADAFGSYPFPNEVIDDLKNNKINFRLFAPLFSNESIYFGRRLHHKVIVADKQVALTGGINVADKYNANDVAEPWLDYAVLVKGDVCEYLHLVCESIYEKRDHRSLKNWEKKFKYVPTKPRRLIRFRRNDWLKRSNEVHVTYLEAIQKAKRSVTIVASYFLPGRNFRNLLKRAIARKVEVKVILAGKSDVASVRLAENFLYDFYLRHNIKIYEWQNSVMHGKAMIVDNEFCTIGSYNLNYLSHYISIELNADIIDETFAQQFSQHLNEVALTHCNMVNKERLKARRNWFRQFKMWLAYCFYRIIMNFVLMARRQREKS